MKPYNKFKLDMVGEPVGLRIAVALERIADALEREDERIEIKGDIADHIANIEPTITPFMRGVSDIPEHRLKDTVYENARDGGLAYDYIQGYGPIPKLKQRDEPAVAGYYSKEGPMTFIPNDGLGARSYELGSGEPLPSERRHTIPEGYKRLPKHENCPLAWRESDGSKFCPHGSVLDKSDTQWEHDLLQAKYRERHSGHTVSDTARQRGMDVVG